MKKVTLFNKLFSEFRIQDALLCGLLGFIAASVTFFNLGDIKFPQTDYNATSNKPIFIDFGQMIEFEGVVFLNGGNPNVGGFRLYAWDGGNASELFHEETRIIRFHWLAFQFPVKTRYVIVEPSETGMCILEMGFVSNDEYVKPVAYQPSDAVFMFDETWVIPENPSYINNMYFDETIHAFTAYEFIHSQMPHEWTHPPLGKSIIALGINIFGMTPFGWRFMSALFGVLMIFPIYALGKRIFKSRLFAFFASFVFIFDFMRFVQARVATLDSFLLTFIICAYLFMYEYSSIRPENRLAPKALMCLALSGVFMGLAISVKWQGAFAGLGLFALFVLTWNESRLDHDFYNKGTFTKSFSKTVVLCVLFFIVVPIVIYCLAYIPFSRASGLRWPEGIIENQLNMLKFHTQMAENNIYQSRWWTWPLNLNPMVYNRLDIGAGRYSSISSFGNPALWWGGLLALLWCVYRWIANKDKTARFLCVAWIAHILPWAFISRSSFIYHYFPCVPFLALMVAYFIKTRSKQRQVCYTLGCCALVFIMFVVFYPALSGMTVNTNYIALLEWLPGWQFIRYGF